MNVIFLQEERAQMLKPQELSSPEEEDAEMLDVVNDDEPTSSCSSVAVTTLIGIAQPQQGVMVQNSRRRRARRNLKCSVCLDDRPAAGIHFGCAACAACAAFFRRSVALQRVYICTCIERCPIPNVNCKFCRFQRCVQAGMRENEVQEKRSAIDGPIRPFVPRDVVPREYYQVEMTVLDEAMTLSRTALAERLLEQKRRGPVDEHWPRQSFKSSRISVEETERPIFHRFLSNSHIGKCIDEDDFDMVAKEMFLLWINIEGTKTTMRHGGVQLNRAVHLDETYLELDEKSVENYLNTNVVPVRNVEKLARMILPFYIHHTRCVARTLQSVRLSELELIAIFQLTAFYALPSSASESTRKKLYALRTKVLKELTEHYESVHINVIKRLDTIMHIIATLREQLFQTRELIFYLIIAGQGGDLTLNRLEIYLHIADFGTLVRKNMELDAWKQAIVERELSRAASLQARSSIDSRESTPAVSTCSYTSEEALSIASQCIADTS